MSRSRAGRADPVTPAVAQRSSLGAGSAPTVEEDSAQGVLADQDAAVQIPRRPAWAGWELILRICALVVALVAALVSAVFEVVFSTMRAGDFVTIWRGTPIGSGVGPTIPVSIVLAVVLNFAIAWFAVSTTGRRWAAGPPWALWTVIMLFASGVRTSEGDYLLGGNNWVALIMILLGSLTFAGATYRAILTRGQPAPRA